MHRRNSSGAMLPPDVVGVILAGGRSVRMGGRDKSLLSLSGRPLLAHVIARLHGQVRQLVLNANGDPGRFSRLGLHVFADSIDGFVGPLGGILTALKWAQATTEARWIVTVPTDTPFLPGDLVARLIGGLQAGTEVAVARSRNRQHPTVALWSISLVEELSNWLRQPSQRAIHSWLEKRRSKVVDFEDETGFDPFFNINTPDDLAIAERHLEERG